jgi:hypothetical protein
MILHKIIQVRTAGLFLVALVFAVATPASANEMNLRGSPDEVAKQIRQYFPVGVTKMDVLAVLKERFGADEKSVSIGIIPRPIAIMHAGKKYLTYFSMTAIIYRYRSAKRLFTESDVSITCNFDESGRLMFFTVAIDADTL